MILFDFISLSYLIKTHFQYGRNVSDYNCQKSKVYQTAKQSRFAAAALEELCNINEGLNVYTRHKKNCITPPRSSLDGRLACEFSFPAL